MQEHQSQFTLSGGIKQSHYNQLNSVVNRHKIKQLTNAAMSTDVCLSAKWLNVSCCRLDVLYSNASYYEQQRE